MSEFRQASQIERTYFDAKQNFRDWLHRTRMKVDADYRYRYSEIHPEEKLSDLDPWYKGEKGGMLVYEGVYRVCFGPDGHFASIVDGTNYRIQPLKFIVAAERSTIPSRPWRSPDVGEHSPFEALVNNLWEKAASHVPGLFTSDVSGENAEIVRAYLRNPAIPITLIAAHGYSEKGRHYCLTNDGMRPMDDVINDFLPDIKPTTPPAFILCSCNASGKDPADMQIYAPNNYAVQYKQGMAGIFGDAPVITHVPDMQGTAT